MSWRVIVGDCVEVMRAEPADSVDAIVTDPPYGLEFMGKAWDSFKTGRAARYSKGGDLNREAMRKRSGKGGAGPQFVSRPAKRCGNCGRQAWSGNPCTCEQPDWRIDSSPLLAYQAWTQAWATEALRVLKPGAHLLAFGGTRTYHRLVCALEDAGFEIRDTLAWMYGSGFPKSLDVSKAIDKAAGAEREGPVAHLRHREGNANPLRSSSFAEGEGGRTTQWCEVCGRSRGSQSGNCQCDWRGVPATAAAQQWQGWGTALKPAFEPIVLARKPLSEKTVAANIQRWGTGALNIDETRIGTDESLSFGSRAIGTASGIYGKQNTPDNGGEQHPAGRWPANVLLDERAAQLLDEQSGERKAGQPRSDRGTGGIWSAGNGIPAGPQYGDTGGPSRYFYTAKASRRERTGYSGPNDHPTVKPVALMRWLVKLITPPDRPCWTCGGKGWLGPMLPAKDAQRCPACHATGTIAGVVLDPFMGTGTTGIAAVSEGFGFVGIDQDAGYVSLAERRIHNEAGLFSVQEEVTTQEPTR